MHRSLILGSLVALAALLAGCAENPYMSEQEGEIEDEMNNAAGGGAGAQPGAGQGACPDNTQIGAEQPANCETVNPVKGADESGP